MIEGFDQASAVVPYRSQAPDGFEHLGEVCSAEIRHAKDSEPARRIVAHRVDRHDMRVLEPRQNLGLVAIGPRHLDRHRRRPRLTSSAR